MLKEYAVDPSSLGRLGPMWFVLSEGMGVEKGRIVAEFPRKWQRAVWEKIQQSDCLDYEKKNLVERIKHLGPAICKSRDLRDNSAVNWLSAAISENARYPFSGILTEKFDGSQSNVINPVDATANNDCWQVKTAISGASLLSSLSFTHI